MSDLFGNPEDRFSQNELIYLSLNKWDESVVGLKMLFK